MDSVALLNSVSSDYITNALTKSKTSTEATESFSNVFDAAKELVTSTNTYIEEAQQAEIDFALGKITSTHELGVIQQKANLSLQYTVAIRDKLMDAYKEIMQMQI